MAGFEPPRPVEPDTPPSAGAGTGRDGVRTTPGPVDGQHAAERVGAAADGSVAEPAVVERTVVEAVIEPFVVEPSGGRADAPDEAGSRIPSGRVGGEQRADAVEAARPAEPAPANDGPGSEPVGSHDDRNEAAGSGDAQGVARALRGLARRGGHSRRGSLSRRDRSRPHERRGEPPVGPGGRPVTGRLGPGAERPETAPGAAGGFDGRTDSSAQEMPAPPLDPVFQHGVVVGFDGSLSSERALAYAVGMARRSQCGLVIVHVANRLPATVWAGCEPPVFVDLPDHRTEVLGLELACADFLAGVPWVLIERGGDICHEIEEVGREYAADAIVVGTTHGLLGKIFGSVSGRLARRANRPVIVIP